MYIKYTNNDSQEFGIWEVSKDMRTQRHVYYNTGSPAEYNWIPLDPILLMKTLFTRTVDVITKAQVEELMFVDVL